MQNIFRKTLAKENKYRRFIGGFVSDELMSYLSLYSLATDVPKSTIFVNVLKQWYDESKIDLTEEDLIDLLLKKAKTIHKQEKHKKTFNVNVFYANIRTQLNKKGVMKTSIDKIIKKLKYDLKEK